MNFDKWNLCDHHSVKIYKNFFSLPLERSLSSQYWPPIHTSPWNIFLGFDQYRLVLLAPELLINTITLCAFFCIVQHKIFVIHSWCWMYHHFYFCFSIKRIQHKLISILLLLLMDICFQLLVFINKVTMGTMYNCLLDVRYHIPWLHTRTGITGLYSRHKINSIVVADQVVTKLCTTLCNPMDWSMPGSLVPPHLPEFAQVHVHWIGDTILPSQDILNCVS